jgi:hypothetical protein
MPAGPVEAVRLIETVVSINGPPRPTRNVLLDIIVTSGWLAGSDAAEKAELWLDRFTLRASFAIAEAERSGRHLPFCFNSSGNDYLQGSCYIEPGDSAPVADAKLKRSQTLSIFEHCRRMSSSAFEILSGKILNLLQVEKSVVTRHSADQGIDFFGRVPLGQMLKPEILSPGAEKNFSVWLVGQSKHYPNTRITTAEIRELVGSVELARAKVFAGSTNPLDELRVRLCDPIIYLFFTTGQFSKDSIELLDRSGVLSFDGLQISQFLADNGIGIAQGNFDAAAFDRWLGA